MDDRSVWERCLQPIVRHISAKQEEVDPVLWNEIYHVFCYQFRSVLKLWPQDDFANEKSPGLLRGKEDARFVSAITDYCQAVLRAGRSQDQQNQRGHEDYARVSLAEYFLRRRTFDR